MWTLSGFADEIDPDPKLQFATLNDLGITHVEFRSAWDTNVLDLTDEQIDEVAALLATHNLEVSSIGSPLGKINIDDDFDAHLVRAERALAVADRLNAPFIRIFSFFLRPDQAPERHRDEVLRRMASLTERAAPTGVVLLHENEKEIYGDVPERVLDIVESVGSRPCGWPGIPPTTCRSGSPCSPQGTALRPYTAYVQIKDALLATGDVVPAGEGDGQVRDRPRSRRRFDGFFSMEPHLGSYNEWGALSGPPTSPAPPARSPPSSTAKESHTDEQPQDPVRWSAPASSARSTPGRWPTADVAELVAVVDRDEAAAQSLATRYGVEATTDLDAVLRRDDIDAVTICTPSGLHADGAVAALDAGKHVVVEKPVDITLAAADRIIDAEKRSGKTVTVISQHRFDKSTEKVQQAVRDGHLGTITSAIASHAWWRGQSYYDSGDWRGTWALDGGGAVINQTVHTINLMITTVGVPVEVFAYTGCLAHERIEVEDTAVRGGEVRLRRAGHHPRRHRRLPRPGRQPPRLRLEGSAVITDDELVFFHAHAGDAPEIGMQAATAENQVTDDDTLGPEDCRPRRCAPPPVRRLHRRRHHRPPRASGRPRPAPRCR
jgi:sugar phosphate isomerase/epimerase